MITKQNCNSPEFLESVNLAIGEEILVDKPLNWSSFKVIHELRKALGVKKAGHAGTLDPRATGLLIVCIGKSTKKIISFQDLGKVYTGTIKLGESTPSMDGETEVSETRSIEGITSQDVMAQIPKFTGLITQIPPMYSAVNHNGTKLYKLARKGRTVERNERQVTITSFEITDIQFPFVSFRIACSKGTYIRVIAHDLGEALGCGGYLTSLRRESIGEYRAEDAFTPDELRLWGKEHSTTLHKQIT